MFNDNLLLSVKAGAYGVYFSANTQGLFSTPNLSVGGVSLEIKENVIYKERYYQVLKNGKPYFPQAGDQLRVAAADNTFLTGLSCRPTNYSGTISVNPQVNSNNWAKSSTITFSATASSSTLILISTYVDIN